MDLQQFKHIENLINSDIAADTRNLLQVQLYMSKKQIINEIHKNKISICTDGRFRTYVGTGKARKELRAATEKELFEKLWEYYHLGGVTFDELFSEWLIYRKSTVDSVNTALRDEQRFKKYFSDSKLLNTNIGEINKAVLQDEFTRITKHYSLKSKEFKAIRTVLNLMFEYAVSKSYIEVNFVSRLLPSCKFAQSTRKASSERIFTNEEYVELHKFLQSDYERTGKVSCLAARFQLLTGLRYGELAALTWSDVDFSERVLHVHRSLTENKATKSLEICEHTKTYRDRFVSLVPSAIEILFQISQCSDYIFSSGSQFLTSRALNYAFEKSAKHLNFAHEKRSHACRRTYASKLASFGVELETIRNDLGHSVLSTTLSYIYEYDPHASYEKKCAAL